jgi:hypothetical protein
MSKIASILACGVVASRAVQAFPGSPAHFPVAAPEIMPVRGFCGLGLHRGPYVTAFATACRTVMCRTRSSWRRRRGRASCGVPLRLLFLSRLWSLRGHSVMRWILAGASDFR